MAVADDYQGRNCTNGSHDDHAHDSVDCDGRHVPARDGDAADPGQAVHDLGLGISDFEARKTLAVLHAERLSAWWLVTVGGDCQSMSAIRQQPSMGTSSNLLLGCTTACCD